MKRIVFVAMLMVFVAAFMQAPATVWAQSAPALKKIPLTYADHVPPTTTMNVFFKTKLLPKIQEQIAKAGYQLDVTYYHAGSLYKMMDQLLACDQGLVDMTIVVMPYEIARFPLHEALDLAFMGWDGAALNKVWGDLDRTLPEFKAEMSGFAEILRYIPNERVINHNIQGAKVPEDFKGKRIHASGTGGDMYRAIGAVPIRQNPGDWYTSLDRGLMDGISIDFGMLNTMKLYEAVKNHLSFTGDGLGYSVVSQVMNRKKFNSLPPEVQKAFEDNLAWGSEAMATAELALLPNFEEGARKRGNAFVQASAAETDKWRAAVKPVHEKWIKDVEAKGFPARKVYDEARRLSQKYSAK